MIFVTAIVMVVMATYTLTYIMAASVSSFGGGIPFGVVLMSIIIALLMVIMMVTEVLLQGGTLKMAYKAFRGQDIRLGDMFYGFKGKTPWHILGISFVIGLIQVIFMIPYFVCYMPVSYTHLALGGQSAAASGGSGTVKAEGGRRPGSHPQ